ncbi:hypothetical protein PTTG_04781 [Puccinia triticina 1-1 BBBD Race 1]|uniref:Uncharacterized protein n=1 Tax=Puccinia triticina (isolate 1-1 / race 1 (BBBD)) TaxID=630390 RepID=A0A180G744_PUCT1|nr:hypothetical protein PTTG_04781 [Puccinia triticina 1-1 BBBD Race 1]
MNTADLNPNSPPGGGDPSARSDAVEPKESGRTTPPPTQEDAQQNIPHPLRAAPSFAEFALQPRGSVHPAALDPEEAVLDTEIQEITPEEFVRSINSATIAAEGLLRLKLPRTCKRLASELAQSIVASKRRYDSTGAIPEEEAIRIRPANSIPPSTQLSHTPNNPPKKRAKKSGKKNPADLLTKQSGGSTLSSHQQNGPEGAPSSHQSGEAHKISKTPPPQDPQRDTWGSSPHNHDSPAGNKMAIDKTTPPCPRTTPDPLVPETNGLLARPNNDKEEIVPPAATHSAAHALEPQPANPADQDAQPSTVSNNAGHAPPAPTSATQGTAPADSMEKGQDDTSTVRTGPTDLTILRSDDIRLEVLRIHRQHEGTKPSWVKYQTAWEALSGLVKTCPCSMQPPAPAHQNLRFQGTTCSYAAWIKSITALATQFLPPGANEQWNCPDLIDFPLLSKFGNNDDTLRPAEFISTTSKSPHPESTIVRFLYRFLHPPANVHTEWAKIIAASVETMSENLFQPPPVTFDTQDDQITRGVQMLEYLDAVKNSSSNFATPAVAGENPTVPDVLPRSHSVDILHEFRNTILDVLMAYIIFQTHANSEPPLTEAQKKSNRRALHPKTTNETPTGSQAQNSGTALDNAKPEARTQLQKLQRKQNFQPLVYFVLGGVRGLFIASRNHRVAGIAECMSFIEAMAIISRRSAVIRNPEEPIWKNVSALLVRLFTPVFQSPNATSAQIRPPTRYQLAEAITNDFLNHWQTSHPTTPFLLPNSSREIPNE